VTLVGAAREQAATYEDNKSSRVLEHSCLVDSSASLASSNCGGTLFTFLTRARVSLIAQTKLKLRLFPTTITTSTTSTPIAPTPPSSSSHHTVARSQTTSNQPLHPPWPTASSPTTPTFPLLVPVARQAPVARMATCALQLSRRYVSFLFLHEPQLVLVVVAALRCAREADGRPHSNRASALNCGTGDAFAVPPDAIAAKPDSGVCAGRGSSFDGSLAGVLLPCP
jgi:hypothetical protein